MKAVIIGLGWQGKRHYEALKDLGVDLACVIDAKPDLIREKFPNILPELVSDNEQILEKYKPDVAIISTNASERLKIVRYCVEAGIKKIFCEKPMATNYKDAIEMKRITDDAGCLMVINHLRRFNANYEKLMKVIDDGVIGNVKHLYAQAGSVGLGNEGTHIIDKMRLITRSDVDWVIGFLDSTGTPNPRGPQYRDPAGWGMLQFNNGTRAFIDTSEDTGVPSLLEVVGTYGRIIIEELNNNWKISARSKSDREIPLTKLLTPLFEVPVFDTLPWNVKEFTKCGLKELILEDKISCSANDGCKAIEAIIGIHVSHSQDGAKVFMPLNEKHHLLEVNWA